MRELRIGLHWSIVIAFLRLWPVAKPARQAECSFAQCPAAGQGRADDREQGQHFISDEDFTDQWVKYPEGARNSKCDDAGSQRRPRGAFLRRRCSGA